MARTMRKCKSCDAQTIKEDECYKCRRKQKYDRGAYKRNRNLLTRYGISSEEFDQMLKDQEGKCAICEKTDAKRYVVDHCHDNGHIRGILCATCNKALGKFNDNVEGLQRAIDYLERSHGRE